MTLVFQLTYEGKNGSALKFVEEMENSGLAALIRQREGNLSYNYFQSLANPEQVLLVDEWENQEALDRHHASPQMAQIMALQLTMTARRLISADGGLSVEDRQFIRE